MFLLNNRETNCSHNPTGPPRETEVLISFAPEQPALLTTDFSKGPWVIRPQPAEQCKALLPFSLHWADSVSQGAQEAMAPPVGMALLPLQLPAVDELWPGKAELWFPRASPAHPGDRDRALLCSCTPCPTQPCPGAQQWHLSSGSTTPAASPQRLFTYFKCQLGYFFPPLSLPLSFPSSSSKILT